jgi:hypothetical protein
MAESTQMMFTHKEVVECLVKKQGLTEGIWGLFVKFGMLAANIGPTPTEIVPTAMVGLLEIGLQKMDKESNITVDAAKVNPVVSQKIKSSHRRG